MQLTRANQQLSPESPEQAGASSPLSAARCFDASKTYPVSNYLPFEAVKQNRYLKANKVLIRKCNPPGGVGGSPCLLPVA